MNKWVFKNGKRNYDPVEETDKLREIRLYGCSSSRIEGMVSKKVIARGFGYGKEWDRGSRRKFEEGFAAREWGFSGDGEK